METVTITKEEYESLQEAKQKLSQVDSVIHHQDVLHKTFGIAKRNPERPFTKEIRDRIAEGHTAERARKLLGSL